MGFQGGLTIDTHTGPLTIEPGGYATMAMYVAIATGGGRLEAVQKLYAVASGATCAAA